MDEIPDPGDYVIDCDGAWLRRRNQDSTTVLEIGGGIDARNADAVGG